MPGHGLSIDDYMSLPVLKRWLEVLLLCWSRWP
jgi:hypothetical protein